MASTEEKTSGGSITADALQAAGDSASARDVRALDAAAAAADEKLAPDRPSLVTRLIYGPVPSVEELQSGARLALQLEHREQPIVDAAIGCLAIGQAFTADGKIAAALRCAIAEEGAYGYTVPAEFGGRGATYPELARVEELLTANGLGPLAVEVSGELTIGAGSVLGYGTDAQKRTFLPMIAEGELMGFALTEVGVGVNAKKIRAYVEEQPDGSYRLFAEGRCNKLWITNAKHGGILGLAARIGRDGREIGLFLLQLPAADVTADTGTDYEFSCRPSGVAAFTENYNARLHFKNFPLPQESRIPGDGVAVLFYCLRMGRCMLAAMSAGYQRMLACDAAYYAIRRVGVGGPVINHELPRLALGRMLGGMLQARALAFLSLKQDADGVDLAGLRDLTKSAAASAGLESMIACEHVLGGRAFDGKSRVNAARVNLHLFGVVEGEDEMIRMGMVRDITRSFVDEHLRVLLDVLRAVNEPAPGAQSEREPLLRLSPATFLQDPIRGAGALVRLLSARAFWRLLAWAAKNLVIDLARLPQRLLPAFLMPRYQPLPPGLRRYARFAERKLRGLRWTYLGLSAALQLELTRAQIPLQRFGLCVEYLVSMLAVCHHAAVQDTSQQKVAALQAQLLKDKLDAVKLLRSWRDLQRMRRNVAAVGDEIASGDCTLLHGIDAEPFAHPWEDAENDELKS